MSAKHRHPNIIGYTGYWGSGKSLAMCDEIVKREAADPRLIVGSTFGFKSANSVDLNTIEDVVEFAAWRTPGWRKLIAADEVQSLARARSAAAFPPAADVVFTQGRKLGLSVLWSSQHWRFVDVNIRRVTDMLCDCSGHFWKRLTPRGELPQVYRPRLITGRIYRAPDPERATLPDIPNAFFFMPFRQQVADRYDTMRLVENAASLMRQQVAHMEESAIVEALHALVAGASA